MLFFPECSTVIRGALKFVAGAPGFVAGAAGFVAGAAGFVASTPGFVAGICRCSAMKCNPSPGRLEVCNSPSDGTRFRQSRQSHSEHPGVLDGN